MFKQIWPANAEISLAAQVMPTHVTIVVAQRLSMSIETSVSLAMPVSDAQRLCSGLLESAHQMVAVAQAQRIINNHDAVFTNVAGCNFSVVEGIFFHSEVFVIEEYSAFGHWIESIFGELDAVYLDTIETNSLQPFVICACY